MTTVLHQWLGSLGHLRGHDPRLRRRIFLAGLALIVAITTIQYLEKISRPGDSGQQTRSAFLRWRQMILDVFHGENIYTGLNEYPNPPIMAVILRPFAELPPVVGAMSWFVAKILMAIVATIWVFRLLRQTARDESSQAPPIAASDDELRQQQGLELARAAAILIALPAMLGDLTHNNINIFILFLCTAALELYRNRRDTIAGIVIGLAIACKVTPLLVLAYFAWKRAWRVCAGTLVGLVFWLAIIPGAALGWEHNEQLLSDWYRLMVERPVLKGEITTERANQAIPGFVYRLFTHSPSSVGYIEVAPRQNIPFPAQYHNVMDIGRPAAWWLVKSLSGLFALTVMILCRAPRSEREGLRFAAECGLIFLGMLLFSERTWKHHAVTLLLPAAVLASSVALCQPGRLRGLIMALLAIAWTLITIPGVLGPRMGELALVYGTHTCAFLLLTVGTAIVLARLTASPSPKPETMS